MPAKTAPLPDKPQKLREYDPTAKPPDEAPASTGRPVVHAAQPVEADAFAAAHPEGTKALLARLLAEREAHDIAAGMLAEPAAIEAAITRAVKVVRANGPLEGAIILHPRDAAALRPRVRIKPHAGPALPPPPPPVVRPTRPAVPPRDREVSAPTSTREGWMLAAVEKMRGWFPEGETVPPVRVSFGWPGGRGSKKGVRGQCWAGATVDDGQPAIFISPDQHELPVIALILLHEMIHAAGHISHAGDFVKVAKTLGFTKAFTSSANHEPELAERIDGLIEELGQGLGHARVNSMFGTSGAAKPGGLTQTTRMVAVRCPADGYTVRTTRKWLQVGTPTCPCGAQMEADAGDLGALSTEGGSPA